jgi:predicted MPP superfamily phosphohydrolase
LGLILFLLLFLLVYGGFHLHFFFRLRLAFALGGAAGIVLAILLLIGLTAPLVVRFAEEHEYYFFARFMSVIGYYWMAFLMLFCAVSLCVEIFHLGAAVFADKPYIQMFIPGNVMRFVIPVLVSIILVIYGSFEARGLQTEFLTIPSAKIPKEMGRIRIVQISDVHIGGAAAGAHVAKIIHAARALAPDIIVSTGDLVDGKGPYVAEAAAAFRQLRPRWGKYAITGNHEFYLGLDEAVDFTKKAGFVPLSGEVVTMAGILDLIGVDDPGGIANGGKASLFERNLLSGLLPGHFKVLLKHRPVVDKNSVGLFDLQLSGHTHKGQIFPFSIFTKIAFPYHAGDYHLSNGSLLHVNRGAGVWGPPIRVLAPPEVTVIDIVSR